MTTQKLQFDVERLVWVPALRWHERLLRSLTEAVRSMVAMWKFVK